VKAWLRDVGEWLVRVLQDRDGLPSSKRLQSFFLIVFACILAWEKYDIAIVSVVLGSGLTLQGVTAFQR